MKISIQKAVGIFVVASAVLLINSCKDPLYDAKKGLDKEISIGGDSLALPIGSTDTMRLGDFLSSDDMDFLKTMEDGGYGFTMSDSLSIDDILKDLDVDKLKFADQVFNQSTNVSFGDISVEDFVIPGFSTKDTMDMKIPAVELGDITPALSLNDKFGVNFSKYALNDESLSKPNLNLNTGKNDFLANVRPFSDYSGTNPIDVNFDLGQDSIDIGNLSVTINYSIDVPEGITTIHQIDLDEGGQLEIELALGGVSDAMSEAVFSPNITIDPTDLFEISPLLLSPEGNIILNKQLLHTNTPTAYSNIENYDITAFHNLPSATNKIIDISKIVNVWGKITAKGKVTANKMQEAKMIDLIINVRVKNVKIKNMDFEIPKFSTIFNGSSSFSIYNNQIPKEINKINTVYFGKKAGSSNKTNLVINITPSDLPVMLVAKDTIKSLTLTFPQEFKLRGKNLSNNYTYTITDIPFERDKGIIVELDLDEIGLSAKDITSQTLDWGGNISYSGELGFGGRMNSIALKDVSNPSLDMVLTSDIKLNSANVTTNQINESFDPSQIPLEFETDITDKVDSLGYVNVKQGCFVRIKITKPDLPLELKSDGIKIQFSHIYEFYSENPDPNYIFNPDDNSITIPGEIPDNIEIKLKALHINKSLDNGKFSMKDTVLISGGISLLSGTVNSKDIENLKDKKLIFEATVSDMGIESTSIKMKTLETKIVNSTPLKMEINDIPNEIVSLDSILLNDGAKIDLEIAITDNLKTLLGENKLNANIKLKFPSMLKFASGEVNSDNELTINEAFASGKLSKSINLRGLQFDGRALDGKIIIDDQVSFDATVTVVNPTINSDDLNGKTDSVKVKVTLAGLTFKSVYGKFNVDFGDQLNIPNVALDLPDFLKGDGVVLDIANPVISLATESNIGIPVAAELSFTKFKNGAPLNDDKLTFNFSLPQASSPSEFIKTGYWFSPSDAGKPADYTFTQIDNLPNLFKPVPDSLKIDLKPTIIMEGYQHFIDLIANYKLKVKYDIIIPFTFGRDFSVVMKDTIQDINLSFGDMDLSAGGLELSGKITNSIPLNLKLELLIMDENFNIISAPEAQTIQAGATNGDGVVSNINIRLTDSNDDLKKISKIALIFRATSNSTIAGTPIKPSNFIKAELKARVLGGIKVKL